jgi:hypothetical protein
LIFFHKFSIFATFLSSFFLAQHGRYSTKIGQLPAKFG